MTNTKKWGAFALAAALSLPSIVLAQAPSGLYLGGSIGSSNMRQGCNGTPAGLSCDQKDTGWKLFGGYQFTPHWGAEAMYVDLGKTKFDGVFLGLPANANVKVHG